MTAVAVRDHGSNKQEKVIRLLYAAPSEIKDAIETWIAMRRVKIHDQTLLLSDLKQSTEKMDVEDKVRSRCYILKHGQRCVDWFIFRQFRFTGTIYDKVLQQDAVLQEILGYPAKATVSDNLPKRMMRELVESWF